MTETKMTQLGSLKSFLLAGFTTTVLVLSLASFGTTADDQKSAKSSLPKDTSQTKSKTKSSTKSDAKQTKKRTPQKGRLPAFFADFVSAAQRAEIYAIQADYDPQIEELQKTLAELRTQRDQEIDHVLTRTQLSKINRKRAARSARLQNAKTPAQKTGAKKAAAKKTSSDKR